MDHRQLRDFICSFSLDDCPLGNQGYNRVLLQLFGYTGHGKSSFINSCKYVLDGGNYIMHAEATAKDGGLTMDRRAYQLTDTITIVDNRGCIKMNNFEMLEIYSQLAWTIVRLPAVVKGLPYIVSTDPTPANGQRQYPLYIAMEGHIINGNISNFLPLNQKVEWKKGYDELVFRLEESEMDANFTDFIVPMFVYSVRKGISREEEAEIKEFLTNCRNLTGIFPIIILTSKTSGNYFEVEQRFRSLGAEVVFGVENYTKDDHLKTRGRHTGFLNLMKNALDDVRFRMELQRNQRRERIDRKKFLITYAHNCFVAEEEARARRRL